MFFSVRKGFKKSSLVSPSIIGDMNCIDTFGFAADSGCTREMYILERRNMAPPKVLTFIAGNWSLPADKEAGGGCDEITGDANRNVMSTDDVITQVVDSSVVCNVRRGAISGFIG